MGSDAFSCACTLLAFCVATTFAFLSCQKLWFLRGRSLSSSLSLISTLSSSPILSLSSLSLVSTSRFSSLSSPDSLPSSQAHSHDFHRDIPFLLLHMSPISSLSPPALLSLYSLSLAYTLTLCHLRKPILMLFTETIPFFCYTCHSFPHFLVQPYSRSLHSRWPKP